MITARAFRPHMEFDIEARAGIEARLDDIQRVGGCKSVRYLLSRLAEQLIELGTYTEMREQAHRLTGLTGLLGFKDASRAWLCLSESSDEKVIQAAECVRHQSRRVVAYIIQRGVRDKIA